MTGIRAANPDDAEAIRSVALASWHAAYDDLLGSESVERTVEDWYGIEGLREVIDRSDHVVRVAETDSITRFAHAGPRNDNPRIAILYRIYVRPGQWNKGIGGRLLDTIEHDLDGFDTSGCRYSPKTRSVSISTKKRDSSGSKRERRRSTVKRTRSTATRSRSISHSVFWERACT